MVSTPLSLSILLISTVPYCQAGSQSGSTEQRLPRSHWKRGQSSSSNSRNVPSEGYYDPRANGGLMLTKVPVTYPMGQGEPLNAIISGNSDAAVLKDQETQGGLRNYFLSLGFSGECLGQHSGEDQAADLGDGHGTKNETAVIRWNYGDPQLGSCKETVQGGNHFRYWVQDGPNTNSGAVFMAVSYEKPLNDGHDIIQNGYSLGRDWLVGNITNTTIPTANLTNGMNFSANSWSGGYEYQSDVRYITGLLDNTNDAINHNITVSGPGFNASDGFVAVIEVKLITKPPKSLAIITLPSLWQASIILGLLSLVLS
ncbi:hypothetical protein CPB83DRAFT_942859 [Crepidotus variabilis]|uniref:Uncharacterized protein n=1 Tax=Crepidotus variabilis TaxID=179855 RepID=A0A9P6EQC6_9AGAR|nr:hypothetical protein CPB83DRAFT_942859 [Crepidotus variabilis]